MRLSTRYLALLAAIAITGCANEVPDVEPDFEGLRPSAAAGKADGIGSSAYFEQFRYRIDEASGFYSDGQPIRTFMATSWGPDLYLTASDGTRLEAGLALWMLDDGTAYAEYSEWEQWGSNSALVDEEIVRTQWRVEGDRLIVAGVGYGVAGDYDGYPAITFTFDRDRITPGLANGSLTIVRVRTSSRLEHVERDYAEQEATR